MTTFSLDLPFFIPLDEGEYALSIGDQAIGVQHSVVEQGDFDPRIGDLTGSFGFIRDQRGVLRYSKLALNLTDAQLERLGSVLIGDARPNLGAADYMGKGRLALAVCNQFLDKYRVAVRNPDVKPVGPWDLALMHFEDGQASGDLRLYGGGITLPVECLSPEYHQRVLAKLADPEPPAVYELAAVDALRAVEDGEALESIVTAIGALEAALDLFWARSWRSSVPRVLPPQAARIVGVRNASDVFTVEDVLEKAGVRSKLNAYATAKGLGDEERDGLVEAIDLRNLAVHGGVRVPASKAKPHVERLARFVLDQLAPTIGRECPALPRAEFLYACEEALGAGCSPELQRLADTYLITRGLTARLCNERFKRHQMVSERFGNTLVMRITFRDYAPDEVNLFVARALLYHSLERRRVVPRALPADQLPFEEARLFWQHVASALTRAVWGAAIDRRLRELGFDKAVQQDTVQEATELRNAFGQPYNAPGFLELGNWVDYLRLAKIAAALPPIDRESLMRDIGGVAPTVVRRAATAIPGLEAVTFEDFGSIRDALVQVHDAHESLLATVTIFDPVTRQRYGRGLRFEDLFG